MNIARILYPIRVLGPGRRVGIWMCGCPHNCYGCSNPELHSFRDEYEMNVESVIALMHKVIADCPIDGITITGGDPFYQPKALRELLSALYELTEDILVYTGYTLKELQDSCDPDVQIALQKTGVLIDGPYIEEKNDGVFMCGSNNQNIIILRKELKEKYQRYFSNHSKNEIQNFKTTNGIISVGIHQRGFKSAITDKARERGVLLDG